MFLRKAAIAAAVALLTISTLAAGRDGITKRVRFAKGKSSITLSNAVIRGEQDTYIVGAKAGQKMTVRVTAVENNAAFQIEGPGGNYLDGAGATDDATRVTVTLPDGGDYRIIVGGTRGNASYRLTISIR